MKDELLKNYELPLVRCSLVKEPGYQLNSITTSEMACEWIKENLADSDREYTYALYLDNKNVVISASLISIGSMTSTIVDIRVILRNALLSGCVKMILVHNHPSGVTDPSIEDIRVTEKLFKAANLVDITLLDHIIVGDDMYSFKKSRPYILEVWILVVYLNQK